jgi:hypothetical protein
MATFLDQPGMPLVTAEPIEGGRIRLSQERFLPAGARRPPLQTWEIPLVLKFSDGTSVKTKNVVLAQATEVVDLGVSHIDWVAPNGDAYGYYRWRAPAAWMKALASRAGDTLDPRERMDFAYDAKGLLDAGAMHADEYLDLTPRLVQDHEPLVVGAALDGLAAVRDPLITTDEEPAFARYVRGMLTPALDTFGRLPRPGEKETVQLVRPRLLVWMADEGKDKATRAFGDSLAHAYLANAAAVDPGMAEPALAIAALGPDRAYRDTLQSRFETAPNPGLRRLYLGALVAFHDSALVAANLDYALRGPLKPQELGAFLRGPGISDPNRDQVWAWMQRNYASIMKRMPPMYAVFMPFVAGGCSNQRLEEAQKFFAESEHAAPGTDKEVERLGERVGDCLELREREGPRARAFLDRTAETRPTP